MTSVPHGRDESTETDAEFSLIHDPELPLRPRARSLRKDIVMKSIRTFRFLKMIGHAAALVFGAFWLVATTSVQGPAQDCFTGISNPTTLQLVLGTPEVGDAGTQTAVPSCQGIDGLAAGGTVVLTLSQQGSRPQNDDGCWAYQTQSIQGATDVTVSSSDPVSDPVTKELTIARGEFSSSTAQGCRGGWELTLGPAFISDLKKTLSPLDASPTQPWRITRSIDVEQAQFCDGAFTGSGGISCADEFPVTSITQVSP